MLSQFFSSKFGVIGFSYPKLINAINNIGILFPKKNSQPFEKKKMLNLFPSVYLPLYDENVNGGFIFMNVVIFIAANV